MSTPSPRPDRTTTTVRPPVEITHPADHAADAVWERLSAGLTDAWLDEVRTLRYEGDSLETSLDVWSVGLIAALKRPERRDAASVVLTRLRKLDDQGREQPDDEDE